MYFIMCALSCNWTVGRNATGRNNKCKRNGKGGGGCPVPEKVQQIEIEMLCNALKWWFSINRWRFSHLRCMSCQFTNIFVLNRLRIRRPYVVELMVLNNWKIGSRGWWLWVERSSIIFIPHVLMDVIIRSSRIVQAMNEMFGLLLIHRNQCRRLSITFKFY